ncbi:MAG: ParA family protein [Candidatus Helarchaeota archaeon]
MGVIISFINLKGGVGKTTCTANIAGEFARENRKVLVIDADAQANVSTLLMGGKRYNKEVLDIGTDNALNTGKKTIYQIFLDEIDETNLFKLENAIIKNVVRVTKQNKTRSPLPTLDLLPSSFHLMQLEQKIVTYNRTKFIILYKTLKKIKDLYDLILIDCPPNIYTATHNALYASDYYIIPTTPDFLARTGIPLLINNLIKTIRIKRDERDEGVELAGILINMYDKRLKAHENGVNLIKAALNSFKKNKMVCNDSVVFKTLIRNKVDIKNASSNYAPLCVFSPRSESTLEFKNLCKEILDRISNSEG